MIKVELLDYKYRENNAGFKNQNLVNFNNVDPAVSSTYWNIENIGIISIDGSQSVSKYISPICGDLTNATDYEIEVTISDYNNSGGGLGEVGISSVMTGGTGDSNLEAFRRNSDGTASGSFTCIADEGLRIFAAADVTATVTARLIQRNAIMFSESIIGILDVGDSDDFPLAVTFSISEARDLNSRTGTYSKTFKIPATKNNNRVLKHSYYTGSTIPNNNINTTKKARIVVNDNFILTGLIQITTIASSSSPLYYSCIFYGNNVDWSQSLDNKLLMNLSVLNGANGSGWDNLNGRTGDEGIGLQVNEPSITSTWEVDNAVEKTNSSGTTSANQHPVIYPIVGYGIMNEGGETANIQLLETKWAALATGNSGNIGYYGFYNNGSSYPTPTPSCDWRPSIFVYDIIQAIFNQEGYTISSNFIETDFFKKLLMLLPNFVYNNSETRVDDNSIRGSFGTGFLETGFFKNWSFTASSGSPYDNHYEELTLKFLGGTNSFVTTLNSAIYDNSTGFFTIQEYGFFDINFDNFGLWLDSVCGGNGDRNYVDYIKVMCEVQTAGQSSWNNIGESFFIPTSNDAIFYSCPNPTPDDNYNSHNLQQPIQIENRWLNKNDKIRFQMESKGRTSGTTIGWDIDIYGGTNITNGTSNNNALVNITHHGERVEYGQTYDLKNVIDNQSTQLSFLKGVIHAFNLQFTTDVQSKTVYIEPFNDFFMDEKDAIDWTSKIDLSKAQEDKWVNTDLKREIIFKYKTDSNDKKVEYLGNLYWDGILDSYPYREFLDESFEVGTQVYENPFFAGSYNSRDGMTSGSGSWNYENTPDRANLWGLCDSGAIPSGWASCRPDKGYNFVPRLLNYVKDNCNGGSFGGRYWASVQNYSDTDIEKIHTGSTSPSSRYEVLCRACSYDNHTEYGNAMQPLTYNSKNQGAYDCATDTEYSQYPYRGLYQTYYQSMVEMQKDNPRMKLAHLNLKVSDLVSLDLRRLVYIDGYYYRINRIVDYKPNSNETTKVELIYWNIIRKFPANASFNQ
tara:strand:+ start:488 stop:3547 length:3060 start_codon:yes stop_codon:yes gene_type:complete